MGEKLNRYLEKPLFVYLFGLFFLVYKTSQYFPSFVWYIFILFYFIYFIVTSLLLFILNKTKISKYRFIIILFGWFFFLFTNSIRALDQLYILLTLLFISFLFFLREKVSLSLIFLSNKLTNFFILSATCFALFNGIRINNYENKHYEYLKSKKEPFSKTAYNRDIIWILLDEYAAPSSLRSEFHFKDELVDSLEKKIFCF